MPRFSLPLLACALAALTFAGCDAADPATASADARQARVPVCHYDAEAGTFALITVAEPAVAAHLAHGDVAPDASGACPTSEPPPPPTPACFAEAIRQIQSNTPAPWDWSTHGDWVLISDDPGAFLRVLALDGSDALVAGPTESGSCVLYDASTGFIGQGAVPSAERAAAEAFLRYIAATY